ncbi:sensor histidine kinase [Kitasatospora sp. NPDC085464]|uniref:sensor histidine kinase n=1 Tax=Kitasatospora sp. NPDC085464 TaxID=3364063 RepID=UPI0037CC0CC3
MYFAITEALTNAAKHGHAGSVSVTLARVDGTVRGEITDDGRGGAAEGRGSGLRGMRQRIEAVDGTLRMHSPPGGPTVITVECPCAS